MATIKTLIFVFLSTLTISSAQLAARHPNVRLSEGYFNDHDLYARAEPKLHEFDVRNLVLHSPVTRGMIQGTNNVNNAAHQLQSSRRRDAEPYSEADTLDARDPFLGGLIKGVVKGIQSAVKGRKGGKKGDQGAKKGIKGAKQGIKGVKKGIKGVKQGMTGAKQGNDAMQQSQPKQRRSAEPYSEADTLDARDPFLGGLIKGVVKGIQSAVKGRKGGKKGDQGAKKGIKGTKQGIKGAKQGIKGAKQGFKGAKQGIKGAKQGTKGAKQGNDAAQQSPPKQNQRREVDSKENDIYERQAE